MDVLQLLPAELRQAVLEAFEAVQRHPQHALLPMYRARIYYAIRNRGEPEAHIVLTRLALLSVRKVLPVWEGERPGDPWAGHLVDMAEAVLRGDIAAGRGRAEAEGILDKLAEIALAQDETSPEAVSPQSQAVILAAKEALFEASGLHTFAGFDSLRTDSSRTDADHDPWTSDTALYAAAACSGAVWDKIQDPTRRKEFWEWWLLEAIPQAWEAGELKGSL